MVLKIGPKAFLSLLLVLFLLPQLYSAKADFLVQLTDSAGQPLQGAAVLIYYQQDYGAPSNEGFVQGLTDERGAWRGSISFERGNTASQYVQIEAVLPTWSSGLRSIQIPQNDDELVEVSFSTPSAAVKSSFRLISENGEPVQNAKVAITSPYFLSAKTDPNGEAVFLTIPYAANGGIAYLDGKYQEFIFAPSTTGGGNSVEIKMPFTSPKEGGANFYSVNIFLVGNDGKPLASKEFEISPPSAPIKVFSDTRGAIYLSSVPYGKINLSWAVPGYVYSTEADLSSPSPIRVSQPSFLSMATPTVFNLGEGCYRIQVELSDPRQNSAPKVSAQSKAGTSPIGFIIDKSTPLGANKVGFYRIICVDDDTAFTIDASNQYENLTASIQLRKFIAPEAPSVSEIGGTAAILSAAKPDDDRKLEVLVLLFLLLILLALFYLSMRFKEQTTFLLGSTTRFLHSMYTAFRSGKMKLGSSKAPPSPVSPQNPPANQQSSQGQETPPKT